MSLVNKHIHFVRRVGLSGGLKPAIALCASILFLMGCRGKQEEVVAPRQMIEHAKTEYIENKFGMKFITIPAGKFLMGSDRGDGSELPHVVRISKPFALSITPLTGRQLSQIRATKQPSLRALPDYDRMRKESNQLRAARGLPMLEGESAVIIDSWNEAYQLGRELSNLDDEFNYRLPTEAEWEYACRSGDTREGPPVRDPSNLSAWKVSANDPNAFGLYDMKRGLGEYCQDWYSVHTYDAKPSIDPQGPAISTHSRVVRGKPDSEGCYSCWKRFSAQPQGDEEMMTTVRFVLEKKVDPQ
ncbi:formylglycine-generating enzyme family protein [Novipirellula aureliae]|nr:SUMF1/EgtB/PvdO family nonheme iron enzyme [Novipirellula aureliae]